MHLTTKPIYYIGHHVIVNHLFNVLLWAGNMTAIAFFIVYVIVLLESFIFSNVNAPIWKLIGYKLKHVCAAIKITLSAILYEL